MKKKVYVEKEEGRTGCASKEIETMIEWSRLMKDNLVGKDKKEGKE